MVRADLPIPGRWRRRLGVARRARRPVPQASASAEPRPDIVSGVATHRSLASEEYCYLTTTGRVSGRPREIEIWFALLDRTVYLLAGGGERANWVRNLRQQPRSVVQIGDGAFEVTAREPPPGEEAGKARAALFEKYSRSGSDLTRWRDHGLLVALDLA